jgi:hypothetical protein
LKAPAWTVPPAAMTSRPSGAVLPAISVRAKVIKAERFHKPPPPLLAELPEMVLWLRVRV